MSYMSPMRPSPRQRARAVQQELERKADQYSQTHPDGPVPNPRTHRMVGRLWRVLQGRHHGRD